ncbi:MAG: hypothetical protein AB3N33_02535 [Puniceicoccaceae bacterium]
MKKRDTTVKLDGSLVEEVAGDLEPGETLTGYVRKAVQYRIQRSRMRKAAEAYCQAAEADPELAQELESWEAADLAKAPQPSAKGNPE